MRSVPRRQLFGISQGCTLIPLLCVIVMTVLLDDAVKALSHDAREEYNKGELADVVFADDTLLMGVSDVHVSSYLHAVAESGKRYGMELHWGKFQVLPLQCSPSVMDQDGNELKIHSRMDYLGTVLTDDVHDSHELVRRIALAKADFQCLMSVWRRSALTWKRKLAIYNALIESRLLYGLSGLWLTASQQRKLNGFQNRCIRSIIGIKPAYYSRISNADVLQRSGHILATNLLKRQLQLLGKVLRAPEGHPLRTCSFVPNSNRPATDRYVRRVGRPCKEWVPEMIKVAVSRFGSWSATESLAQSKAIWNSAIKV